MSKVSMYLESFIHYQTFSSYLPGEHNFQSDVFMNIPPSILITSFSFKSFFSPRNINNMIDFTYIVEYF